MKKYFLIIPVLLLLLSACSKEDLPPTDFVMVKFENKTGKDIDNLTISRAAIRLLKKGKKTDYIEYEALGQQYGVALVEAVGDIDGKRFYASSACQGICGTASAPDGEWLEAGYYKVAIGLSDEAGGNYLEFVMLD